MSERGFIHQLIILIVVVAVIIYAIHTPIFKGLFLNQSAQVATQSAQPQVNPVKVSQLESQINDLQNQINDLKKPVPSSAPSPSSNPVVSIPVKYPIYIPLGNADPITDESWVNLSGLQTEFDPSSYPGYSSLQLLIDLRVNAEGVGSARVFNRSNNQSIDSSVVSTGSTSFVSLTSNGFRLGSGINTLNIQGMSGLGDSVFFQNARLKVNF